MSLMTDFIVELYRSANEVSKLGSIERVRLIERALSTVKSMTEQLLAAGNIVPLNQRLSTLKILAQDIQTAPDPLVAHAFLEAADIIKNLHHLHPE